LFHCEFLRTRECGSPFLEVWFVVLEGLYDMHMVIASALCFLFFKPGNSIFNSVCSGLSGSAVSSISPKVFPSSCEVLSSIHSVTTDPWFLPLHLRHISHQLVCQS
jgi:hypothetical protein